MSIPWDQITPSLLERYSGPAPRYTSYPTAPEWSVEFGPHDYASALERADRSPGEPLSVYVHIPYCRQRCRFCGCASSVCRSDDDYDVYLEALEREVIGVAALLPGRRRVAQLHWGGGTPTVLDPPRLTRLMSILTGRFTMIDGCETAIEVAPAFTTHEQIDTLAGLGFNRISMGVQDVTPAVQEAVGRIQGVDLTRRLFARARQAGFRGINIDLMYGLPRQTPDTWRKNIETVVDIGPDRLAVFGYAHVPWMRPHQKEIDERELPGTDLRFELFRMAHDMLLDAGYVHIGMDHFARPGDELSRALDERRLWRNFQGYTVMQAGELIGLGATAIGDLGGAFAQNQPDIAAYMERTRSGGLATYRGMITSQDDRLRRAVITELMCNLELDVESVERRFDIDFWSYFGEERAGLDRLADDGLVTVDHSAIRVTPIGRMFVRHVGLVFDTYSGREREQGPRFSRTV